MRYKFYRATTEPTLHLICRAGRDQFDKLPERVRKMGPWQGGQEGEIEGMRAHYRALLAEQGFVVVNVRQDLLRIDATGPAE